MSTTLQKIIAAGLMGAATISPSETIDASSTKKPSFQSLDKPDLKFLHQAPNFEKVKANQIFTPKPTTKQESKIDQRLEAINPDTFDEFGLPGLTDILDGKKTIDEVLDEKASN